MNHSRKVMPAEAQKTIILSCNTSRSNPQIPVENIVEGRINSLLRDKAYFVDKLADERLKREDLDRTLKRTEEDFQQRFNELEETINRLKTENESAESAKDSLMATIQELETDLNAVNATLNATRQEFHRKHDALTDAYRRLEDASIKMKRNIQKAWIKCKELQEENDALTEHDGQHFLEKHELCRLNSLLRDELQWYETQEAVWMETDKLNLDRFSKLNGEILACLHVYGQLTEEKAKNLSLREKNSRLQYELEKLRLDVKSNERLMAMKGMSDSLAYRI